MGDGTHICAVIFIFKVGDLSVSVVTAIHSVLLACSFMYLVNATAFSVDLCIHVCGYKWLIVHLFSPTGNIKGKSFYLLDDPRFSQMKKMF